LLGFTLQASAQSESTENTKEKEEVEKESKLDKGVNAIKGLFKRKKKNKREDSDNDSEEARQEKNSTDILNKMLGGKGNIEVKPVYNFNSNFAMRMQGYKKNGKVESDVLMRYYNSADPDYMAMEIEGDEKGETPPSKVIFDGSQQAMITFVEDVKQAIAIKMPNVEDYEQAQQQEENPEDAMKGVEITRTGRTKDILGYTCTETIMENDDMKNVSWTTKEVKISQFKAFAGVFMQKKEEKSKFMAMPMEFTMEMESVDKNTGEKTTMTVTEINENQESTITTSGYQIMDMSGMMKGGKKD
jgi:hypothetical protein